MNGSMNKPTRADEEILVVEDDFDSREMLSFILQSEGYSVVGAANGQEALQHLRRGPAPCLILLDLMMPVMNGWEFRDAQAQDPSLSPIPVVVISADVNVKDAATSIGASGWLNKPVDFDRLLDLVRRHC
ncbi:MAG TPA: response regulator [Blastocatellia bacterium]|nr:response regulator [Blastocatellia bacterium]